MSVIHSRSELHDKLHNAASVSPDHPVVLTKFIEGAQEIDVDAVASNGDLILHAISEHVEAAGVHSGCRVHPNCLPRLILPNVRMGSLPMMPVV